MSAIFYGCKKLTNLLPLENWNTESVTDMDMMFTSLEALTDMRVEEFLLYHDKK